MCVVCRVCVVSHTKFVRVSILAGQISPGVRRGLVMISKVLQNLANGIEFGCKEAHMAILNPFIIENLAVVHMFFDKLTVRTYSFSY